MPIYQYDTPQRGIFLAIPDAPRAYNQHVKPQGILQPRTLLPALMPQAAPPMTPPRMNDGILQAPGAPARIVRQRFGEGQNFQMLEHVRKRLFED